MSKIDIIGAKFGRLTVFKDSGRRTKNGYVIWLCKCECGKEKDVPSDALHRGRTKSCGCLRAETSREKFRKKIKKKSSIFSHGGSIEDLEDLLR